jgi:flagellar biosynthesis protein FlhB
MEILLLVLMGIVILGMIFMIFLLVHFISDLKMFKKRVQKGFKDVHDDITMVDKTIQNQMNQIKDEKIILKG